MIVVTKKEEDEVCLLQRSPLRCSMEVRLFADDTKVLTDSSNREATAVLQDDLDRLQQWSQEWLLRFHPQICSVLKLGSRPSEAVYSMKAADGTDIILEEHSAEKDLGVFIDGQLSVKKHVPRAQPRLTLLLESSGAPSTSCLKISLPACTRA